MKPNNVICERAKNGECNKECHHSEPHNFDKEYCLDICTEAMGIVDCVAVYP